MRRSFSHGEAPLAALSHPNPEPLAPDRNPSPSPSPNPSPSPSPKPNQALLAALSTREEEEGGPARSRSHARSQLAAEVEEGEGEEGGLRSAWRRVSEPLSAMLEAATLLVGGGGGGGGGRGGGGGGDGAEMPPRQPSPRRPSFALPERGASSLAMPEWPTPQCQQAEAAGLAAGRRGTASPDALRDTYEGVAMRPLRPQLRPAASTNEARRERRAHDTRAFSEGLELDSELRA